MSTKRTLVCPSLPFMLFIFKYAFVAVLKMFYIEHVLQAHKRPRVNLRHFSLDRESTLTFYPLRYRRTVRTVTRDRPTPACRSRAAFRLSPEP